MYADYYFPSKKPKQEGLDYLPERKDHGRPPGDKQANPLGKGGAGLKILLRHSRQEEMPDRPLLRGIRDGDKFEPG